MKTTIIGKGYYWFGRVTTFAGRVLQPINFFMLVYLTSQEQPLFDGCSEYETVGTPRDD